MKNKIIKLIGFACLVITYFVIFNKPIIENKDQIKDRITTYDSIKSISKKQANTQVDDEFGLSFKFKNKKSFLLKKGSNKILILTYKDEILPTKQKSDLVDYLLNQKSKKPEVKIKDPSQIKDAMKDLSKNLDKAINLKDNFKFDNNANVMVIKLQGSVNYYNQVLRLMN